MAKKLLIEKFPAKFQIVEQDESHTKRFGDRLKIRCERMAVADEPTGNGNVYPSKYWSREIEKQQKMIENRSNIGAADHPEDGQSKIATGAILWTKMWMDGKITKGEGVVARTNAGKDLEEWINIGATIDVSSRSWGSTRSEQWEGKLANVVQEDLDLVTFDAVLGGAVDGSHLAAVNEQQKKLQEGRMNWKEIIESLKKDNPQAFEAYEKELKATMTAEFEKTVLAEMKAQKKTEQQIREALENELKEATATLQDKVSSVDEKHKQMGDKLGALKKHVGMSEDPEDMKDQGKDEATEQLKAVQAQVDALTKKLSVAEAKAKELSDKIAERDSKEAVQAKISEATKSLEHGALIAERLSSCKTIEEVDAKLADEETFVKKLLEEKAKPPTGNGHVEDDDEKDKNNKSAALTEWQKAQRRLIGLST